MLEEFFSYVIAEAGGRHLHLKLEAEFFGKMLALGESALPDIERRFVGARDANDQDEMDWQAAEAAEEKEFVEESADIVMLAVYHWIERTLKRELVRHDPSKRVKGLNFEQLKTAFATHRNISFANLQHSGFIENGLRVFANKWKHEPDGASLRDATDREKMVSAFKQSVAELDDESLGHLLSVLKQSVAELDDASLGHPADRKEAIKRIEKHLDVVNAESRITTLVAISTGHALRFLKQVVAK